MGDYSHMGCARDPRGRRSRLSLFQERVSELMDNFVVTRKRGSVLRGVLGVSRKTLGLRSFSTPPGGFTHTPSPTVLEGKTSFLPSEAGLRFEMRLAIHFGLSRGESEVLLRLVELSLANKVFILFPK